MCEINCNQSINKQIDNRVGCLAVQIIVSRASRAHLKEDVCVCANCHPRVG